MRPPKLSLAAWLAALLAVTFSLLLPAQEKEGKKYANPFTGSYQNLKLLKPDQVQGMMMAARTGFGQGCSYCHVIDDWQNDSKPKKAIGRMMMGMMLDINAKFPDGKIHVTCYTCHRGEIEPAMRAPEAAGKQ